MATEQSTLADTAALLTTRWRELRSGHGSPAAAESEVEMARALVAAVGGEGTEPGIIAAGLEHGRAVHAEGAPLYRLVTSVHTLGGLVLADLRDKERTEGSNGTDWMVTVERVQAACSLLELAALQGFTRSMLTDLHKQYRDIRHDIKNPLGTIKNALSLMADAPAQESDDAVQFRGMAARNTRALETLIRQRLADAAMEPPALTGSKVRLRNLAEEVQHAIASAAGARGVSVVIADELTPECEAHVDGLAFQLLLRSVMATAIRCAGPGTELTLGSAGNAEKTLRLRLSLASGGTPDNVECQASSDDWTAVRSIAEAMGARVTGDLASEHELFLEIPALRGSGRHEGQDLAHSRETHDLKAGTF